MLVKAPKLLFVAALAVSAVIVGSAHAQSVPAPSVPILQPPQPLTPDVASPPPPPPPPPELGTPRPLAPSAPATPPIAPPPPPPPLLPPAYNPAPAPADPWTGVVFPTENLFLATELVFLRPFLPDRVHADTRGPDVNSQMLPTTDLNWTVSPKFEVGWTMPEINRLVALSYRFIDSSGNGTIFDTEGNPSAVRTGFNLNVVDFDFGNLPTVFARNWDFAYRFGIRAGDVYFDTSLANANLTQRASNLFYGAGPHGRVDVQRHLTFAPGLALFGRADVAALVGQLKQHFQQAVAVGDSFEETDIRQRRTQTVPVLLLQAGLSYTPPAFDRLHLSAGYQYEQWWYLGQLGLNSAGAFATSHGDYSSQGIYIRALYEF